MRREEGLSLLQQAIRWAAKLHRGQDRDGAAPLPYITHPIDVMNRLRYVGGFTDDAILIAAALHDVVEECDTTLEEIEARFGKEAAALVKEVTRNEPDEAALQGLTEIQIWELRSEMLLREIDGMSLRAQAIKLADRGSNLLSNLAIRTGEKRARYIRQSRRILEIVPREVNPALWDAIANLLESANE